MSAARAHILSSYEDFILKCMAEGHASGANQCHNLSMAKHDDVVFSFQKLAGERF